jgi:dolichol-phosphate mannosyltransferase
MTLLWQNAQDREMEPKPSWRSGLTGRRKLSARDAQRQSAPLSAPPFVASDSTAGRVKSNRSADDNDPAANQAEYVGKRPLTRRLLESQFARFCAVGASGYAINLAVYAALLTAGLHYLAAAAIAFIVAAVSNYAWNRLWTFQTSDAPVLGQGARALVVSALSLGANQLFLVVLVAAGAGHLAAQAVAVVLATPFSFAANMLWACADPGPAPEPQAVPVPALRDEG